MVNIDDVLAIMQAQFNKPYQFNTPLDIHDPDPVSFDCSGLIMWASARAGATPHLPHNSSAIHQVCLNNNVMIGDIRTDPQAVVKAAGIRGALLIRSRLNGQPCDPGDVLPGDGHIVISMGDGNVIEARGTNMPVGLYPANIAFRKWTAGALIPGVAYSVSPPPPGLPGNANPRNRPYLMHDHQAVPRNYRGADRTTWVRSMQTMLMEQGLLNIPATTGNFRDMTLAAVVSFQQKVASHYQAGFAVDGECGKMTWGWLMYLTGRGNEQ